MRNLFSLFLISFSVFGQEKPVEINALPYSQSIIRKIKGGHIFIKSEVKNFKESKEQSLHISSAGLHKRSCRYALRKLKLYENYQSYLDFVEKSSYDEEKEFITLLLSSPVLPIKMTLAFKFPRVKKPGVYHFQFDKGFLSGLKGEVHISDHKGVCFFHGVANWKGPDTGYNTTLFEFFTATLARIAANTLLRISSTY